MPETTLCGQRPSTFEFIESSFNDVHQSLVKWIRWKMGISREDAEDVVQQAWIRLWQKFGDTPLEEPISMLTIIVLRLGQSKAREKFCGWKRNWRSLDETDDSLFVAPDQSPYAIAATDEIRAHLQEILDSQLLLSPPLNLVVRQRLTGKTFADIATDLLPMHPENGDREKLETKFRVSFHRYKQQLQELLHARSCTLEDWESLGN